MQQHSVLVCDIAVTTSLSVRLTVTRNAIAAEVWIWSHILHTGEAIASGAAETRLAAQVASQRAYEAWLHRNRKAFTIPNKASYNWKEVE
jgi:hypothetical protein